MTGHAPTATTPGDRDWNVLSDPSPAFIAVVLATVETIPAGRVMTYGDIAAIHRDHADLADAPDWYGARLVGQVMQRFGHDGPWWRVIRASGQPPKFLEARALPYYLDERTPLIGVDENYRIDLKLARFDPNDPDLPVQTALF